MTVDIDWHGQFSILELDTVQAPIFQGNGVYQFYGQHCVYGSDVLLYIGQTTTTFVSRALSIGEKITSHV